MILSIVAYGDPVLRKRAKDITPTDFDIKKFSADLFDTMYASAGIGLAAPQVGHSVRMFVVDGTTLNDDEEEADKDPILDTFKKVFVNPEIVEDDGDEWAFEEGCLSIPGIRADVYRPETIRIHYYDINWKEYEEEYSGMAARIIQHEYDHLEGKLFTDYLSPLKRQLIKKKLADITKGKVDVDYRMRFPK